MLFSCKLASSIWKANKFRHDFRALGFMSPAYALHLTFASMSNDDLEWLTGIMWVLWGECKQRIHNEKQCSPSWVYG